MSNSATNLAAGNPSTGISDVPKSRQDGGGERDRTDDLKLAKLALSQLSYAPDDRTLR